MSDQTNDYKIYQSKKIRAEYRFFLEKLSLLSKEQDMLIKEHQKRLEELKLIKLREKLQ